MTVNPGERCLAFIYQGRSAMEVRNLLLAGTMFGHADELLGSMAPEEVGNFTALVLCHFSLLAYRSDRVKPGKRLQDSAMDMLDKAGIRMEAISFQDLMAKVLVELGEYRRAIPFCERAIEAAGKADDPLRLAGELTRAGNCYNRLGLRDYAAIFLRPALSIFQDYPGDSRLPSALLNLGNALRKSQPAEAERLYREAADFHVAKGHFESAAAAWANLGVLCAEQDRHNEALRFYGQALRVREAISSTPAGKLGLLLNNLAGCLGRTRDFEEAHMRLDQAIEVLKLDKAAGVSWLAHAYGTRGQIFKDQERYEEALSWLERSYEERMKSSSPNLDSIREILEDEIEVLKRLGRSEKAELAEGRMAAVLASLVELPLVDRKFNTGEVQDEGSVSIEIGCGSRPGGRYGKQDVVQLLWLLKEAASALGLETKGTMFTIPESTTVMLRAADPEAMIAAVLPIVYRERICKGAVITVRQGKLAREMIVPGTLN